MAGRRENVPFDSFYFEKQARAGVSYDVRETFQHIYAANHWSGSSSVSGEGASADQTRRLQLALPGLLEEFKIGVLLDLPCGDFSWMSAVALPPSTKYIGADVVPEIISSHRERYETARRQFVILDLIRDALPAADLLFCRDCLVHLSFADIFGALANIKRGQVKYLLTTTFTQCEENEDITTGDWRVLNLERPPFNFPPPLRLIDEQCSEGGQAFRDKSLGLWEVTNTGC